MAAPTYNKVLQLSRAAWQPSSLLARTFHTHGHPLLFQATQVLNSSVLKKKKKMDMGQFLMKQNKRKRTIEKEIKKFEKKEREYKPIDEIQTYVNVARSQSNERKRETAALSFEECEERALLSKEWCRYKTQQHHFELAKIHMAISAQQSALAELRKESEELYQQAIQLDDKLIPFHCDGITRTPPIENFDSPDGEYVDTSKKY